MSLATKVARATSQGGMVGRVPYGDPGLFGAIGGALKTVARGAAGFFAGGPAGAAAAVIPGLIGGGGGGGIAPPGGVVAPVPGVRGAIQRAIPGGQTGYMVEGGMPLKGYRANKTSYFLKDGTFVPAGTRWVKIRRRNSLNPRALSRAMSRLEGAKKASKSISRISIRKKCS